MMRPALVVMLGLLIACPAMAQEVRTLEVEDHRLRVRIAGLDRIGAAPVVVFEGGAGQRLETWSSIFSDFAVFAPAFAYDRAGLGESAPDPHLPVPEHVASTLRGLLAAAGLKPPYVLVGHSWGGPLIRMFAGKY